jgi:hypothetical protein
LAQSNAEKAFFTLDKMLPNFHALLLRAINVADAMVYLHAHKVGSPPNHSDGVLVDVHSPAHMVLTAASQLRPAGRTAAAECDMPSEGMPSDLIPTALVFL